MRAGRFITFEGPEGGGKTTQVRDLAAGLRSAGYTVCCVREPGGTAVGEVIRGLLQHNTGAETVEHRAELLLFGAARAQLVERLVRPALDRGEIVLCDRFSDSTVAYQGFGRGLPLETVTAVNDFAEGGLQPALTLLLDLPPETGLQRLGGQVSGRDRIESESLEFHRRVRAGYLSMARRSPRRFAVIDAAAGPRQVAEAVWERVNRFIASGGLENGISSRGARQ